MVDTPKGMYKLRQEEKTPTVNNVDRKNIESVISAASAHTIHV